MRVYRVFIVPFYGASIQKTFVFSIHAINAMLCFAYAMLLIVLLSDYLLLAFFLLCIAVNRDTALQLLL